MRVMYVSINFLALCSYRSYHIHCCLLAGRNGAHVGETPVCPTRQRHSPTAVTDSSARAGPSGRQDAASVRSRPSSDAAASRTCHAQPLNSSIINRFMLSPWCRTPSSSSLSRCKKSQKCPNSLLLAIKLSMGVGLPRIVDRAHVLIG